ncbi:hypothetical protein DFH07DRAFT_958374 [Mycena maculata]|uniref:Uncharacterized protein n=1 Tax=Mycena maculata TaxID=230809 RepID=A0AAD7J8K1_9AGAR|nr:hypothetical protein DFH07DRAFT_958374 [Mycena maculata]
MHVLGNPDHYASHKYVNFPYVAFVKSYWAKKNPATEVKGDEMNDEPEDVVFIQKKDDGFIPASMVDDYRYRPTIYENLNLYEWVQCAEKKARTKAEREEFEEQVALYNALNGIPAADRLRFNPDYDNDGEGEPDSDSDCNDWLEDDMEDKISVGDDEHSDTESDSDWDSEDEDEAIVEKE